MLTSAAIIGIDSTPIEDLSYAKMEVLLAEKACLIQKNLS